MSGHETGLSRLIQERKVLSFQGREELNISGFPVSLLVSVSDCLNGIPPLFLLIGIITLVNEVRFGKRAVAVEGEVIDLHYKSRGKGRGSYHPVVRFHA